MGRGGHDGRKRRPNEARGRHRRVFVLEHETASRGVLRAGSAEGSDGRARASDEGREAVLGATVGGGGCAGDAVGDDELESRDRGILAEDDLGIAREKSRESSERVS